MNTNEKEAVLVPPYGSFVSFESFLKGLKTGIPGRIDKSVMTNLSGGVQTTIIQALKYLKLIDADGIPTDKLAPLVNSEGAEYQKALRAVLGGAYPFLIDQSTFKLNTATPKQLDDEFEKLATGDTVRKCVTFFIPAAKAAALQLSPHIKEPKKRTVTNGKAKKPKAAPAGSGAAPATPAAAPVEQQPAAMTWHQLLLSKFPSFDPNWTDEVKSKWMDSFADLMKKGGG
jgi:hypothetical protein